MHKLSHTQWGKTAISVRYDQQPQNHNIWHYHDELEFIQIKRGGGSCFVGDRIQKFASGDIVLIGSNTPHYWLFDDEYLQAAHKADIRVIHFMADFCGAPFLQLHETKHLKELYEIAKQGLLFNPSYNYLSDFFENVQTYSPFKQLTALLDVLDIIHIEKNYSILSSLHYVNLQYGEDYHRMNKILEYIRLHYRNTIRLQDVASTVGLTTNSFCRYFKQKTGKTFIQLVHELRIAYACKLLQDSHLSIKKVCFESGYQNFVSFHKNFKQIVGVSPNSYKTGRL